jgi:UDP-glucuronate decarboxylase
MNEIVRNDLELIINANINWHKLKNKSILISGATSFLATYIIYILIHLNKMYNYNIKIILISRSERKLTVKWEKFFDKNFMKFIICDISKVININDKVDYVLHLASNASPIYYDSDPIGVIRPNVYGTMNLLKLAQENDVDNFLYFSTCAVLGQLDENNLPAKETDYGYIDPTNVLSCYGESKRMGENICVSWWHQYNVPITIVRPSHTYGPTMRLSDGRVFSNFLYNIMNDNDLFLIDYEKKTRTFCYISDAVSAFFLVLLNGKFGEAYNVGGIKETKILDLAKLLKKNMPESNSKIIKGDVSKEISYRKYNNNILRNFFNSNKIKEIGWKPSVNLNDGIIRTINYFKDVNKWKKN